MLKNIGLYAKFVVGAAAAIITGLTPYYGHDAWFPGLTAGIGALLVYLVPNAKDSQSLCYVPSCIARSTMSSTEPRSIDLSVTVPSVASYIVGSTGQVSGFTRLIVHSG